MQNYTSKIRVKKNLNADSLIAGIRTFFGSIADCRSNNITISLPDALMSGFAIFSLKEKSLLDFEKNKNKHSDNLKSVYGIENTPTDTHLRTMLDIVDPESIRPAYKEIFHKLKRSKALEEFIFYENYYLLSIDGTGYFSSQKVHCDHCMEKTTRDGKTTYYHQFLGAAIVHPDKKEVIAFPPEIIQKQDGSSKNDCERNATKRYLQKFRKDHPKLKVIVIEDGLSSNAPHIQTLKSYDCQFILGAKPNDHKFLFKEFETLKKQGEVTEVSISQGDITHVFSFHNDLPLNESNQDVRINFLNYWEINNKTNKTQHFTYVTGFHIDSKNVYSIMRGGRTRWKIENETFNTLKNQGYHFEHNFGHGQQHLSNTFATLMMLAFLVDQTLQISCKLFNAAREECGTRTNLWWQVKSTFFQMKVDSMNQIYEAIFYGSKRTKLVVSPPNSS